MTSIPAFDTLRVALDGNIATVELARPDKANAMILPLWHELRRAFDWVDATPQARVAILRGAGRHFTAGMDLAALAAIREQVTHGCEARLREKLRRLILDLQDTLTSLERCRKPVIAAIHGACVGGGVDLICCCDMRYCSADASFSIKEIDIGMTADVGTLQRLPRLIGPGMVRELAYTGRFVAGAEAQAIGLVNRCFASAEELHAEVAKIAAAIATKSPLAIRGTKEMLNYARDHTVADGLNHIATWNAAMLLSRDMDEAISAAADRRAPVFED